MIIDVVEAKNLDNDNGNKIWQYAIKKQMKNSQVAFQLLDRKYK